MQDRGVGVLGSGRRRELSFEIYVRRKDRWMLECVTEAEDAAMAWARQALAQGGGTVKVVRIRTLANGVTSEFVIFEESASVNANAPVRLGTVEGGGPLCQDLPHLFGAAARQTLHGVLRDYLVRQQITVTELLHGWSHLRRLADQGSLLSAVLHRIGSAQAQAAGVPPRERIVVLDRLAEAAMKQARDATAERKRLPAFTPPTADSVVAAIAARVPPERIGFHLNVLLTDWLFERRGLMGRLEAVLEIRSATPLLPGAVDELLADLVGFGEVVQELVGPQPGLGRFLLSLLDRIDGDSVALADADPLARDLFGRVAQGDLPETKAVLLRRVVKELAGDTPLDRTDRAKAESLLDHLAHRLLGPTACAWVEGAQRLAVEDALARRRLEHRRARLRSEGLHTIADNLRMGLRD